MYVYNLSYEQLYQQVRENYLIILKEEIIIDQNIQETEQHSSFEKSLINVYSVTHGFLFFCIRELAQKYCDILLEKPDDTFSKELREKAYAKDFFALTILESCVYQAKFRKEWLKQADIFVVCEELVKIFQTDLYPNNVSRIARILETYLDMVRDLDEKGIHLMEEFFKIEITEDWLVNIMSACIGKIVSVLPFKSFKSFILLKQGLSLKPEWVSDVFFSEIQRKYITEGLVNENLEWI